MEEHDDSEPSWLTRFGRLCFRVSRWRCKPCKIERRPLLDMLGIEPGRISGSLARLVAILGVAVPYELGSQLVHQFFGVNLSAMGVWRVVQRLGEAAEQHTESMSHYYSDANSLLSEPAQAPAVVVAGVDGCALGMQVHEHRRHRKTPDEILPPLPKVEEGLFREVKTGVVLLPEERVESSPGRHSVVRRALVTCLGNADQVFDRLWAKLQDLGWMGAHTVVVIVGDGAEWIWNRAKMFPNCCEILDFWHALEKAWDVAHLKFGEGSKQAVNWARRIGNDLRAGKVDQVIDRLLVLRSTTTGEALEKLDGLIRYYTDNASRMHYDLYLRLGYGIGSGAVESSHKQLVHARMRQAGMRWSEAGARRLLALRVLLLNGEWAKLDRLRMVSLAA
jgi:hypothetical protein